MRKLSMATERSRGSFKRCSLVVSADSSYILRGPDTRQGQAIVLLRGW